MPSELPSRSNGYTFALDHKFDPSTVNGVLGDIHFRLVEREALEASFEALEVEGIAASIEAIQVGIAPQLQTVRDALTALQQDIDLAEDQLLAIQQGGVSAANVGETATRVFVTPAQRDEIGQLRSDLGAEATARANAIAAAIQTAFTRSAAYALAFGGR